MKVKTILGLIAGAGAGAAAMYLLDPDRGGRRRSMLRDKLNSKAGRLANAASGLTHDISNRAYGKLIEARKLFRRDETVSDDVLEARVRSKMGRIVSDPHAINVKSDHGEVTVSGTIREVEVQPLLRKIKSIPGVSNVENALRSSDATDFQSGRELPDRVH